MWEPVAETCLKRMIEEAEGKMPAPVQAFWNLIKVAPRKWQLPPWGDAGGGFWVVAIVGQECIYYNDIEDGFNRSQFADFGLIGDYWCDQSELDIAISAYRSDFLNEVLETPQS